MLSFNFGDFGSDVAEYLKSNSTGLITTIITFLVLISIYRSRRGLRTPQLQGTRSESFIFGNAKKVYPASDLSSLYRNWERMYGPVYQMPAGFGTVHVVLNDPKALTHVFSKDTITYNQPPAQWHVERQLSGDILIATEGEAHKRIRRALSSPLTVSAIRNYTPVVLDSAYQLKSAWDSCFQLSDKPGHAVEIDIVKWMGFLTMDNVGQVAFSHDFGNLKGHGNPIMDIIDVFHAVDTTDLYLRFTIYTNDVFYKLFKFTLPNAGTTQSAGIAKQFKLLTTDFLEKVRRAPEDSAIHKSVLGAMLKSVNANSNNRLSLPEVTAQAGILVMAGHDTTAAALTWSLIELARQPKLQETLRAELRECWTSGERPTYDQLIKDLKYLDAFVFEILRFHPPEMQVSRVAAEDDVIPLTNPIRTASGAMIDSLPVSKGTFIRIPIGALNISEVFWGPDAGTFDPGRWLSAERLEKRRMVQVPGYRSILTFAAGNRLCPGRDFAILEMKAALAVLVTHFSFEFRNGPSTELIWHFGRPKVASEDGPKVPLLVRRLT